MVTIKALQKVNAKINPDNAYEKCLRPCMEENKCS
jgi:hypothetical protein